MDDARSSLRPSLYRVVAIDQAGHSESGKGRKGWTADSLAGDVEAVVCSNLGPNLLAIRLRFFRVTNEPLARRLLAASSGSRRFYYRPNRAANRRQMVRTFRRTLPWRTVTSCPTRNNRPTSGSL